MRRRRNIGNRSNSTREVAADTIGDYHEEYIFQKTADHKKPSMYR